MKRNRIENKETSSSETPPSPSLEQGLQGGAAPWWHPIARAIAEGVTCVSYDIVGVIASYLVCQPLEKATQRPELLSAFSESSILRRLETVDETCYLRLLDNGYTELISEEPKQADIIVERRDLEDRELVKLVSISCPQSNIQRRTFARHDQDIYVCDPSTGIYHYNGDGKLMGHMAFVQEWDVSHDGAAIAAIHPTTLDVYVNYPFREQIAILDFDGSQQVGKINTSFLSHLPVGHYNRIDRLMFQPLTGCLCIEAATSIHLMDANGSNRIMVSWPGNPCRVDASCFDRRGRIFACLADGRLVVCHANGTFCTAIDLEHFHLQKMGTNGRVCVHHIFVDIFERLWIYDHYQLRVYHMNEGREGCAPFEPLLRGGCAPFEPR